MIGYGPVRVPSFWSIATYFMWDMCRPACPSSRLTGYVPLAVIAAWEFEEFQRFGRVPNARQGTHDNKGTRDVYFGDIA